MTRTVLADLTIGGACLCGAGAVYGARLAGCGRPWLWCARKVAVLAWEDVRCAWRLWCGVALVMAWVMGRPAVVEADLRAELEAVRVALVNERGAAVQLRQQQELTREALRSAKYRISQLEGVLTPGMVAPVVNPLADN